jgi:hypothetical protein
MDIASGNPKMTVKRIVRGGAAELGRAFETRALPVCEARGAHDGYQE